jgi:hypothetical protein
VLEDSQTAVVLEVLVKAHTRAALGKILASVALRTSIGSIQLQQIEGVEEGSRSGRTAP